MIATFDNEPAPGPRFALGRCVATPGALALFDHPKLALALLINRHHSCDWGDLDADDKQANEDAIGSGARILSAYKINTQGESVKLYVITEGDDEQGRRSHTTILRADEY